MDSYLESDIHLNAVFDAGVRVVFLRGTAHPSIKGRCWCFQCGSVLSYAVEPTTQFFGK